MVEKNDKLDGVFSSIIQKKKKEPSKKLSNTSNTDNLDNIKTQEKVVKPVRIPHTYKYEKDVVDKVKAYAYWKRSDISDVVNAVLKAFTKAVEKEEGIIKPIPTGSIQPVKSIKVEQEASQK
ncbi:hypothetical protein KKC91_06225 [bacterium]|nr:hypothetical protein [bacterium]